jgi:hypothetical protein
LNCDIFEESRMGLCLSTLLLALAVADPAPPVETPAFLIPSARAGNSDLFLVDPEKGDARNITKSDAEEIYPAWSPDGKRIAFICKSKEHDLEVYVCDADGSNRKRLTTADSPAGCLTPSWSADGKHIVYMRLPPAEKGQLIGEVRVVAADGTNDRLLVGENAFEPSWSPDGTAIAFIRKVAGKPSALCAVNPDGSHPRVLCEDIGPQAPHFPAWSPDGRSIALTVATDHGLQIALIPSAGGSPKPITHLPGFNINPVWLAADRLLFAHTVQAGSPNGGYASIKIDGTRMVVHSLTKVEPPHALGRPAVYVPRMVARANGENAVKTASFVEPAAVKKAAIKAAPVAMLPPGIPGAVGCAAWSSDGQRLAMTLEAGLVVVADFEGHAVKPVEVFKGHEGPVEGVAFSSDGKSVISSGSDKTVRMWDLSSKSLKSTQSDHDAEVDSLARSRTGKLLATGDRQGKVKIRSADSAKAEREITVCDGKRGSVHALAFGPDDVLFAGCAKWGMPVLNGCVAAFDPATGKELWRTKSTMGGVFSLAVSPDGAKIAGACLDSYVRTWDAKTGAELSCWKGHTDRATGVCWAAAGKAIVSCGFDHTVRVWDSSSGLLLHTLAAHTSPVIRVAVSPDGKHVISTGQSGTVCIWLIDESTY